MGISEDRAREIIAEAAHRQRVLPSTIGDELVDEVRGCIMLWRNGQWPGDNPELVHERMGRLEALCDRWGGRIGIKERVN